MKQRDQESVRILAIDGSLREASMTRRLIEIAVPYFDTAGADFRIFSQATNPLPLYDGRDETKSQPSVQKFLQEVAEADAFVLSSPEYHGSISGALKNALDWLTELPEEHTVAGKVFGLMGGGGQFANSGANVQMMMSVRALHGWLMPEVFMSVPAIWNAFTPQGDDLSSNELQKRLSMFTKNLVQHAQAFKTQRLNRAA